MKIGEWHVFAHPLFLDQLETLVGGVEEAREKDPEGYRSARVTKMLAAVVKLAFTEIPTDPGHKRFEQGDTLGSTRKYWRRAKFYQQYRLFFRFNMAAKVVVLAWVNDDDTKRAYGSRSDAYAVFARMLKTGNPPDDWDTLTAAAMAETAQERLTRLESRL